MVSSSAQISLCNMALFLAADRRNLGAEQRRHSRRGRQTEGRGAGTTAGKTKSHQETPGQPPGERQVGAHLHHQRQHSGNQKASFSQAARVHISAHRYNTPTLPPTHTDAKLSIPGCSGGDNSIRRPITIRVHLEKTNTPFAHLSKKTPLYYGPQ